MALKIETKIPLIAIIGFMGSSLIYGGTVLWNTSSMNARIESRVSTMEATVNGRPPTPPLGERLASIESQLIDVKNSQARIENKFDIMIGRKNANVRVKITGNSKDL